MARGFEDAFINWIGDAISATLSGALTEISKMVGANRATNAGWSSWFAGSPNTPYGAMIEIGSVLTVIFFIIGTIGSLVRLDYSAIKRSVGGGLVVILAIAFVVPMTNIADRIVTNMSYGYGTLVSGSAGSPDGLMRQLNDNLNNIYRGGSKGAAPLLMIVMAVAMLAALVVWLELTIRTVVIWLAVLFIPIAAGGAMTETFKPWIRRLVDLWLASMMSQFIIAVCIYTGAFVAAHASPTGVIANGEDATNSVALLAGFMIVAAWSLPKCIQLIPVLENNVGNMHGGGTRILAVGTAKTFAGTRQIGAQTQHAQQREYQKLMKRERGGGGGSNPPAPSVPPPSSPTPGPSAPGGPTPGGSPPPPPPPPGPSPSPIPPPTPVPTPDTGGDPSYGDYRPPPPNPNPYN